MKLFIQIQDGEPFEHPILEENLKQLYPNIDVENLPENLAVFERVQQPRPGIYEIVEHLGYKWDGNVVKDAWNVRTMTPEEKTQRQEAVKRAWEQNGISKTWTFDEESCSFVPPVPYPNTGRSYLWDEKNQNWKLMHRPAPLLDDQ